MIEGLAERVNGDAALVRRGRYVNTTFLLDLGESAHLVRIASGKIVSVAKAPPLMPEFSFALRASRETWAAFWQSKPPPGYTDLFALQRRRLLRIEGDLHPFMANLFYFKGVLAAPRALGSRR
jgi:hypothetical protein